MARHDDDYRLLRERLGWSQEARRLERLLTDGTFHDRAELQAALDRVWALLPPNEEAVAPVRAALRRIVVAYQVGPHPAMLHAEQSAESA